MNPAFLDNMSWEMAEVYGAVTDQIMVNLARYFPYYKAGSKLPKSAFEYQANMLAQMGQVNADTVRIIRNGLKGANNALGSSLEQAIIDSVRKGEKTLLKGVQAGILKPAGIPIVAPQQMRAFSLYYQQAAEKLNLVNTVMLESTQSAYQQAVGDVVNNIQLSQRIQNSQTAVDTAAGETITGVSSWNEAVRHATNRLKTNGITGFVDHAGRHWSAEAYVAMTTRTTMANTARASMWEVNANFGNDLYIVDYHDGARPLCYEWQNKVISADNVSRDVTDLYGNTIHVYAQSETTYGEPAGLFGINCKHSNYPFIPCVSTLYDKNDIQDPEENKEVYEQTQEQRRLERKLREEKKDLMMAKAQGADDEEIRMLQEKCRKTSSDIDDFCDSTGLPRRRNREAVYTQRDFPSKDKYDVDQFKREQQENINKYFKNGGEQQGYTFGHVTPNQTSTQNITTQTTTQPTKPIVKYGELFDEKAHNVTEQTIADLQKEYPLENVKIGYVGDVRIYYGMDETIDVLDLSAENSKLPDVSAQYYTEKSSKDGIPAIVVHNEGLDAKTTLVEEFETRAMLREKYPKITIATAFDVVSDSLQGTLMHEYGHAIADNYGFFLQRRTPEGDEFLGWLIDYWGAHREDLLAMSKYAASNPGEMFAEAFVQYHDKKHTGTKAYKMAAEIMTEFERRFIH